MRFLWLMGFIFWALPAVSEDGTAVIEALAKQRAARAAGVSAWADALQARADMVEALASANKMNSEGRLNHAKADYLNMMTQLAVQKFNLAEEEYRRVRIADFDLQRKKLDISLKANLLSSLAVGKTNKGTWYAITWFEQVVLPPDVVKKVMIDRVVPELSYEDNFYANSHRSNYVSFKGGRAGRLIQFAERNDLSFRKYSDGHAEVLGILSAMSLAAASKIYEYEQINQSVRLTILKGLFDYNFPDP